MTTYHRNGRIIWWLRWFIRLTSLGLALLLLGLSLHEFLADRPPLTMNDVTVTAVFKATALLIMLAGAILAWRWARVGGILVLAGVLLFSLTNSLSSP